MESLLTHKTRYQEKQAQAQAEREQAEAEKAARRQAYLDKLWPMALAWFAAHGVDPDELAEVAHLGDFDWPQNWDYPRNFQFFISLPRHRTVSLGFYIDAKETPFKIEPYDDNRKWRVEAGHNTRCASTLGEALSLAERLYREAQERQQRFEREKADKESRAAAQQDRKTQQQSAKERLFNAVVASDPAALLLVKLFAEIVRDRESYEGMIKAANDSAYDLEGFYQGKLDQVRRQAAEAEAQAEEARLEADRERWDREQAEETLKKATIGDSHYR